MRSHLAGCLLLVAGGACAVAANATREAPRASSSAGSLLGGLTALAVQVLWMDADEAVREFREDDAQLAFAAIAELEPQLVSSGAYISRALGFDLAEGHSEPEVRWAFAREGWRVLCRTVDANPGDARAHAARGLYALNRISRDAGMRSAFVKEIDPAGPFEWALRDYEEALRTRPDWREPWDGIAIASFGRGSEYFARGDFASASRHFRRSQEAFDHVAGLLADVTEKELLANREMLLEDARLAGAIADVCDAPPSDRRRSYDALQATLPAGVLPPFPAN